MDIKRRTAGRLGDKFVVRLNLSAAGSPGVGGGAALTVVGEGSASSGGGGVVMLGDDDRGAAYDGAVGGSGYEMVSREPTDNTV